VNTRIVVATIPATKLTLALVGATAEVASTSILAAIVAAIAITSIAPRPAPTATISSRTASTIAAARTARSV
jgi:hypothetical protein